jgi:hypothetical protein
VTGTLKVTVIWVRTLTVPGVGCTLTIVGGEAACASADTRQSAATRKHWNVFIELPATVIRIQLIPPLPIANRRKRSFVPVPALTVTLFLPPRHVRPK